MLETETKGRQAPQDILSRHPIPQTRYATEVRYSDLVPIGCSSLAILRIKMTESREIHGKVKTSSIGKLAD